MDSGLYGFWIIWILGYMDSGFYGSWILWILDLTDLKHYRFQD